MITTTGTKVNLYTNPASETTVSKTKTVTEKFDVEGNLTERVTEEWEETVTKNVSTPAPYPLVNPPQSPFGPTWVTTTQPATAVSPNQTTAKLPPNTVVINVQDLPLTTQELAKQVSRELSRADGGTVKAGDHTSGACGCG